MLLKNISTNYETFLDDSNSALELQSEPSEATKSLILHFSTYIQEFPVICLSFLYGLFFVNYFLKTSEEVTTVAQSPALLESSLEVLDQFDAITVSSQQLQHLFLFIIRHQEFVSIQQIFENLNYNDFFKEKLDSSILSKNFLFSKQQMGYQTNLVQLLKTNIMFRKLVLSLIGKTEQNTQLYESLINNNLSFDDDVTTSSDNIVSDRSVADNDTWRMALLNARSFSLSSDLSSLIHYFLFGPNDVAKEFIFSAFVCQFEKNNSQLDHYKHHVIDQVVSLFLNDVSFASAEYSSPHLHGWFKGHVLRWLIAGSESLHTQLNLIASDKLQEIKSHIFSDLSNKYPDLFFSDVTDYIFKEDSIHFLIMYGPTLLVSKPNELNLLVNEIRDKLFVYLTHHFTGIKLFEDSFLTKNCNQDPMERLRLLLKFGANFFGMPRLNVSEENENAIYIEKYKLSIFSTVIFSIFNKQTDRGLLSDKKNEIYLWRQFSIDDLQAIFSSDEQKMLFLNEIIKIIMELIPDFHDKNALCSFFSKRCSDDFLFRLACSSFSLEGLKQTLKLEMTNCLKGRGHLDINYFQKLDLNVEHLLKYFNGDLIGICKQMVVDRIKRLFEKEDIQFVNELICDDAAILNLSSLLEKSEDTAFVTHVQSFVIEQIISKFNIDNRLLNMLLPYVPIAELVSSDYMNQLAHIQSLNISDMFKMPLWEHASYFKLSELVFSLDSTDLSRIFNFLNLNTIAYLNNPNIIPNYILQEMKIPQHIIAKSLLHYHQINKDSLLQKTLLNHPDVNKDKLTTFSNSFSGLMPWELFIVIAQTIGIDIGITDHSNSSVIIKKSDYYQSQSFFDEANTVRLKFPDKDRSSYFVIAMGILALNDEKQSAILTKLQLCNWSPCIKKESFLKGELQFLQQLLMDAILAFHKNHQSMIKFKAQQELEKLLQREITQEDLNPLDDFLHSFSGFMPFNLLKVLSEEIGFQIGLDEGSEIVVELNDNEYISCFPSSKIKNFNFRSPYDIQGFILNRFDKDSELSSLVVDSESLTIESLKILYSNLIHKNMSEHKPIIPMFGVTQSGKTSLFNFCLDIQSDFQFRVGGGVTSETSLYYQSDKDGIFLTDTPGFEDNRSEILKVLINYQLIELLYSNHLENLVIALRRSDFANLASSGIRTFANFFNSFFHIKDIGNGFFQHVFDRHFGDEYKQDLQTMVANALFVSKKEQILSNWNGFFAEIEQNVDALSESPFTFVVRNDFNGCNYDQSILMSEIDKAIEDIKKDILSKIIKNKGVIPLDIQNALLFYLYILLMKKDSTVANLESNNDELKQYVQQKKSIINELKIPFEDIQNTKGVQPLFYDFLNEKIMEYVKCISTYNSYIENIQIFLAEINQLEENIISTKRSLADESYRFDNVDVQTMLTTIADFDSQIKTLETDINALKLFNRSHDTDETMNRDGWPKTTRATGIIWREAVFNHEPKHASDISLDLPPLPKLDGISSQIHEFFSPVLHKEITVKANETQRIAQFPYYLNDIYPKDQSITCHNLTTKREYYRHEIQDNENSIVLKESKKEILSDRIQTQKKLKDNIERRTIENLEKSLTEVIKLLNEKHDLLNYFISENHDTVNTLKNNEENIKLIYQLLKNSNLKVMAYISENTKKDKFIKLVDNLMGDEIFAS